MPEVDDLVRHRFAYQFISATLVLLSILAFGEGNGNSDSQNSTPIGEPIAPRLLSLSEFRAFLTRRIPAYRGIEDFFRWVHNDPEARQYFNGLVSTTSDLGSRAERGNRFRQLYLDHLARDFPRANGQFALATDPQSYLRSQFQQFLESQATETEIPEVQRINRARNAALAEMRIEIDRQMRESTRTGVPMAGGAQTAQQWLLQPELIGEQQFRQFGGTTWNAYQRIMNSDLTQPNRGRNQQRLQEWRQRMIAQIDAARAQNLSTVLNLAARHRSFRITLTPEGSNGTRQIISSAEVGELSFRFPATESSNSANQASVSLSGRFGRWMRNWLGNFPLVYVTPEGSPLREYFVFTPDTRMFNDQNFETTLPEKSKIIIQTRTGQSYSVSDLNMIHLLWHLSRRFSFFRSREHNRVLAFYILESIQREIQLEQMRRLLLENSAGSIEQLRQRLQTSYDNSRIHSALGERIRTALRHLTDHIRMRGVHRPNNDPMVGLEWDAYRRYGPYLWQRRERNAQSMNQPPWQLGRHNLLRWVNPRQWLRRFLNIRGPRVAIGGLAGLLVGGIATIHAVIPDRTPLISRLGLDQLPAIVRNWIPSTPQQNMKITQNIGRTNNPLESVRQATQFQRFHVSPLNGSRLQELPHFFDVPRASDLVGTSDYVRPTGETENATFRINGIAPLETDSNNRTLFYRVRGHDISRIEVKDNEGTVLTEGTNYDLRRDSRTGLLFLQLFTQDNGPFSFSVDFQPSRSDQANPPAAQQDMPAIDSERLTDITKELKRTGFTQLSDNLKNLIEKAEEEQRPVTLSEIRVVLQSSARYSFIAEGSPNEQFRDSPFYRLTRYLHEGRRCFQCNGADEFSLVFLQELFRGVEGIRIRSETTYVRLPESQIVTAATSHVRTIIETTDGREIMIFETTPNQPDPRNPPDARDAFQHIDRVVSGNDLGSGSRAGVEAENTVTARRTNLPDMLPPQRHSGSDGPDEETHKKRVDDLNAQRQQLSQALQSSRALERLSRSGDRHTLPSTRALFLANALEMYASGLATLSELGEDLDRFVENASSRLTGDPNSLAALVREIAVQESTRVRHMQAEIRQGRHPRFVAFGSDTIVGQVQSFFDHLADTNWAPVANRCPFELIPV